ncbi:outer membrane beta-barrel protein [candidate division KSB1 bacterium]|nr:outer membrane beta-barrel protein [candidate division KSB1 bacterium]
MSGKELKRDVNGMCLRMLHAIIFVICLISTNLFAQGILSITERIDKLEAQSQITTAAQREEIQRLKRQIAGLNNQNNLAILEKAIQQIQERLATLEKALPPAESDDLPINDKIGLSHAILDGRDTLCTLHKALERQLENVQLQLKNSDNNTNMQSEVNTLRTISQSFCFTVKSLNRLFTLLKTNSDQIDTTDEMSSLFYALDKLAGRIQDNLGQINNDTNPLVINGIILNLLELTKDIKLRQNALMELDLGEPPGEPPQPNVPKCPTNVQSISTRTHMPEINGFVDASYAADPVSSSNSFGLDQVELDITKSFGETGSIRTDLEWVNDGAGGMMLDAEQGYITYKPACCPSWDIIFGKFNAPIGFEMVDAPDMFQYSHALVYNYGLPANLSGVMCSGSLTAGMNVSIYLCNGWDQNVDLNKAKTVGGRFGYSFGDFGGIGLSDVIGAENAEGKFQNVFDIDLTLTPLPNITFGGELNIGKTDVGDSTQAWSGFLVMGHADFSDVVGLTMRFDYFNDKQGARLGTGAAEQRKAITIAPTFKLGEGMGALMEFRMDISDQNVFINSKGDPAASATSIAFEITYAF